LLPGSLKRKLEPWARPLVEALKRHLGERRWDDAQTEESIEITSLEHIRGLTYDDSIMIIDEGQNTTPQEMKAFLTRIGQGSQVIVCGDLSQSDLRGSNGLAWCVEASINGWVPSTKVVEFTHDDIVRSELCKEWQLAFDKMRMKSQGA
jgi:phosphate starvation-inducible PhoH-like protein